MGEAAQHRRARRASRPDAPPGPARGRRRRAPPARPATTASRRPRTARTSANATGSQRGPRRGPRSRAATIPATTKPASAGMPSSGLAQGELLEEAGDDRDPGRLGTITRATGSRARSVDGQRRARPRRSPTGPPRRGHPLIAMQLRRGPPRPVEPRARAATRPTGAPGRRPHAPSRPQATTTTRQPARSIRRSQATIRRSGRGPSGRRPSSPAGRPAGPSRAAARTAPTGATTAGRAGRRPARAWPGASETGRWANAALRAVIAGRRQPERRPLERPATGRSTRRRRTATRPRRRRTPSPRPARLAVWTSRAIRTSRSRDGSKRFDDRPPEAGARPRVDPPERVARRVLADAGEPRRILGQAGPRPIRPPHVSRRWSAGRRRPSAAGRGTDRRRRGPRSAASRANRSPTVSSDRPRARRRRAAPPPTWNVRG